MTRQSLALLAVAGLTAVPAGAARAQDMPPVRAERPYRGLFASGLGDTSQQLTANARIGGGYDDAILRGGDTSRGLRGGYSSASAGAAYGLALERMSISATGLIGGRRYGQRNGDWLTSRSAAVALGFQLFRSTRVTLRESYTYSPYNLLSLTTGAWASSVMTSELIEDDVGISTRRYSTLSTYGDIAQTLLKGARSSFEVDYSYMRSRTSSRGSALATQRAGGTFRYGMTRNLSVHLAYHYRRTDYPGSEGRGLFGSHDANAGVDFNRPLSLTRRTLVTFTTGSSAFDVQNRTQYRAFGSARLTHEIGRTWGLGLAYARNIGFVETFDRPILYDSLAAGFGGLITRRLQFTTSARASEGQIGLTGVDNRYRTYSGSMTLTTSLKRAIGISAEYF